MTLQQLQDLKQWHRHHSGGRAMEAALCDLVLCIWAAGWTLLLALAVIDAPEMMPVSLLMTLTPSFYAAARRQLHQRGLLRCDWLSALQSPQNR